MSKNNGHKEAMLDRLDRGRRPHYRRHRRAVRPRTAPGSLPIRRNRHRRFDMTDLTPEERTVLRRRIDFRRQMGHERVSVTLPELTALLDAADEADRLQDVERRLAVLLCNLTGGKLSKTDYPVELMEQEIEEYLAGHHESDLRDERDRLAGNRREPRDFDWDRSVDSYHAVGWDDEPGGYERMFFESGWRSAIRALDGADQ